MRGKMVTDRLTKKENQILKTYKGLGYKFLKSGHPDFVFYKEDDKKIYDVIFVEVKSDTDKLSPSQEKYLEILTSLGVNNKVEKLKVGQNPKIVASEETKERLDNFGDKGDTYDSILNKLMDLAEGIKKRVR